MEILKSRLLDEEKTVTSKWLGFKANIDSTAARTLMNDFITEFRSSKPSKDEITPKSGEKPILNVIYFCIGEKRETVNSEIICFLCTELDIESLYSVKYKFDVDNIIEKQVHSISLTREEKDNDYEDIWQTNYSVTIEKLSALQAHETEKSEKKSTSPYSSVKVMQMAPGSTKRISTIAPKISQESVENIEVEPSKPDVESIMDIEEEEDKSPVVSNKTRIVIDSDDENEFQLPNESSKKEIKKKTNKRKKLSSEDIEKKKIEKKKERQKIKELEAQERKRQFAEKYNFQESEEDFSVRLRKVNNTKKAQRKVTKTYTNSDGYLVTEDVFEQVEIETIYPTKTSQKIERKEKQTPIKRKSVSRKQDSITSFFKKTKK